jgi:hypothetical protein
VSKTIEMSVSDLSVVLGFLTDPCSTGESDAGAIPADPESCAHWMEVTMVVVGVDQAIDRALSHRQLGDALGGGESEAVGKLIQSDLQRVVDDFCGTPPRWPMPWPPKSPFKRDSLSAVQLLAAGCRFQQAADRLRSQPELEMASEQLIEAGLARLAENGPA